LFSGRLPALPATSFRAVGLLGRPIVMQRP
jgi:hypothetical protein